MSYENFSVLSVRALVRGILKNPKGFDWSVQGLGMMRVYVQKPEWRLHIWNSALRIPNVSPMHDHPWDFDSLIVSGRMRNQRFQLYSGGLVGPAISEYNMVKITCGENACTHGETEKVNLLKGSIETYIPGEIYHQRADEIHYSRAENHCITLVRRVVPAGRSADIARVFWEGDGGWVDAAPRPATSAEVELVTQGALEFFEETQ